MLHMNEPIIWTILYGPYMIYLGFWQSILLVMIYLRLKAESVSSFLYIGKIPVTYTSWG